MKVQVFFAIPVFCLGMANSLTCQKCLNREGKCAKNEVEVCNPSQDSCVFESKDYHGLDAATSKLGCGTSNYCRRYPEGTRGLLYRAVYCCASDLCQPVDRHVSRSGSQNGLVCQSCIGNKADCGHNAPSQPCYGKEDRCVQISQCFLPGERLEPIIKGCGDSAFKDTLVAYQIGKDFAYVDQKVCIQSNCNNRSFPVIPSGQPNGLQCYTCQDLGHGECARDRLQVLNCTGVMDRCVHIIDRDNTTVTIQKGCATETMCNSYSDIYYNLIRQDSFAKCCKTSLCNRAGDLFGPEMLLMVAAFALWLAWMA
ncbi:urokinase plasminogen activator surface receptor-like [Rhineura floridana]|uniref:urokinase plasminogen activator surface receptor-like n=1 Tax=Rhineura floridana TaxID=261503 RepID=UPI002AC84DB9|nr:urokinase plasminogen activator surface receptor-like [Rhineura floridana]